MKKLLAIVLTLALVLSLSPAVFAAGSPVKDEVKASDLPAKSEAVKKATVSDEKGDAKIVANEDMTEAQKESLDKALEKVMEENKTEEEKVMPVDAFAVESTDGTTVTVELEESAVVYIVYPDGTILKLLAKDLTKTDKGYEITVSGSCNIIIAKAA